MATARALLERVSRICVAAIEPVEVQAPWRDPTARALVRSLWHLRPGA